LSFGGDEFAILMPNRSIEDARAVGERISSLFGQMPWSHTTVPRPTLSIGLATASCADASARQDLIRRADAALYRSKSAGRATIRACDGRATMPSRV
jgi:diguanylate cyclase (GGDEF)-like protein